MTCLESTTNPTIGFESLNLPSWNTMVHALHIPQNEKAHLASLFMYKCHRRNKQPRKAIILHTSCQSFWTCSTAIIDSGTLSFKSNSTLNIWWHLVRNGGHSTHGISSIITYLHIDSSLLLLNPIEESPVIYLWILLQTQKFHFNLEVPRI